MSLFLYLLICALVNVVMGCALGVYFLRERIGEATGAQGGKGGVGAGGGEGTGSPATAPAEDLPAIRIPTGPELLQPLLQLDVQHFRHQLMDIEERLRSPSSPEEAIRTAREMSEALEVWLSGQRTAAELLLLYGSQQVQHAQPLKDLTSVLQQQAERIETAVRECQEVESGGEEKDWSCLSREIEEVFEQLHDFTATLHSTTTMVFAVDELAELEATDPVTSLLNRLSFEGRVGSCLTESQESDETSNVCLIALDGFADVCRQKGTRYGDALLAGLGDQLHRLISPELECDCIARLRGDTFALLSRNSDLKQVGAIVDEVREQISATTYLESDAFQVQITATCVVSPAAEDTHPSELLSRMQHAIQDIRQAGRDRTCVSVFGKTESVYHTAPVTEANEVDLGEFVPRLSG